MFTRIKNIKLWHWLFLAGIVAGNIIGTGIASQTANNRFEAEYPTLSEATWFFCIFALAPIMAELISIRLKQNGGQYLARVVLVGLGVFIAYIVYFLPFKFREMSSVQANSEEGFLMFMASIQIVVSLVIGFILRKR